MKTIDFTYNNFYRFAGHGPEFAIEIDPCTRLPDSFYDESCRIARYLDEKKTGPLYFMYSGGLDSEFVLSIFIDLNIEVIPVVINLWPSYNQFDVDYALRFCDSKGLKPMIIDIDFDHFVKSGRMLEVVEESMCGYYQIPATIDATRYLDGTVVLGAGDPHCFLDQETNTWWFSEIEADRAWQTWFSKKNINGTSLFLGYTPEMLLSYLTQPIFVDVVNGRVPGKLGTYSSKIQIYNKWFDLEPRKKYTGYEIIETSSIFQTPEMRKILEVSEQWKGRYNCSYQSVVDTLTKNISADYKAKTSS